MVTETFASIQVECWSIRFRVCAVNL